MSTSQLVDVLKNSIQTCGRFGALIPSGVRVRYSRDCEKPASKKGGIDTDAALLSVETVSGQKLYSAGKIAAGHAKDQFWVSTFDFVAQSEAEFKGLAVDKDYGIARDLLAEHFRRQPMKWSDAVDGRWERVAAGTK